MTRQSSFEAAKEKIHPRMDENQLPMLSAFHPLGQSHRCGTAFYSEPVYPL
jgi:hypothetical protein